MDTSKEDELRQCIDLINSTKEKLEIVEKEKRDAIFRLNQQTVNSPGLSAAETEELENLEKETRQLQHEIDDMRARILEEETATESQLKKRMDELRKEKDLKKGSFTMSMRREKARTTVLKLKGGNVIEVGLDEGSIDFEKRKEAEISKHAEKIDALISHSADQSTEDLVDQIASILNQFHQEIDADPFQNELETADLLKTTNYQSIHLRKTSTKFRITSKIAPATELIEDVNNYDPEQIEHYEKVIISMSEKAASVAACGEDTLCFGSLVLVNKNDSSFEDEFLSRCQTLKRKAIEQPIVFDRNTTLINNFNQQMEKYFKFYNQMRDIIIAKSIEAKPDENLLKAFGGVGTQIKSGQVEKNFYDKALGLRSLISQLIVIAGTIAKTKPKRIGDSGLEPVKKTKSEKGVIDTAIRFDSNKFELEKLFILESADILNRLIENLSSYINIVATAHKIATMEKPVENTVAVDTEDVPLWEELQSPVKKLIIDEKTNTVDGGSLNRFIELLTNPGIINNDFNKVFMCSFPCYTNSMTVLRKLMERFKVPPGINESDQVKIKFRAMIALKGMLLDAFEECDEVVLETAQQFIDKELEKGKITESLKKQLERRIAERKKQITSFLIPPIDFFIPEEHISPTMLMTLVDEVEIARQITMVDYSIYHSIQPSELYNADVFTKNELRYRAENVMRMSDRVNEICYWVASLILSFPDKANRVRMMVKMINVAEVLFSMNNFHSLAGIYVCIEAYSSIQRLKKTKADLPESSKKTLEKLNKWLGLDAKNYQLYRQHLGDLKDRCVPFITVIGKDLTFIIEGAQATFDFEKMVLKVNDYLKFQQYPYTFPVVQPLYQYISNPIYLPDKMIQDLSLLYEPRGQ
ncbi:Ras guanine nucleotide exchange factor [Entamoeba marina]